MLNYFRLWSFLGSAPPDAHNCCPGQALHTAERGTIENFVWYCLNSREAMTVYAALLDGGLRRVSGEQTANMWTRQWRSFPFTFKSDQDQILSSASPETFRTWLFVATRIKRGSYYQFSLPHLYISLWESRGSVQYFLNLGVNGLRDDHFAYSLEILAPISWFSVSFLIAKHLPSSQSLTPEAITLSKAKKFDLICKKESLLFQTSIIVVIHPFCRSFGRIPHVWEPERTLKRGCNSSMRWQNWGMSNGNSIWSDRLHSVVNLLRNE